MAVTTIRYVVCDVFTDQALAGNQLAVFTNATGLTGAMMQKLAREMNFSESVFVLRSEGTGHARLRIFTPTRELKFAGHPVLGAAFVLGQPMQLDEIRLETGAGVVPVKLERQGALVVFGWMRQPIPVITPVESPAAIFEALGVPGSTLPVEHYDLGPGHVFVALESREAVAAVKPDLAALARAIEAGANVFAGEGTSFKTRLFAPRHGVDEDPATGSAAGPLALHLARHGRIGFGDTITIEQGAEIGRPSTLYARAHGSREEPGAPEVGGSAVVVAHGEFRFRVLPA